MTRRLWPRALLPALLAVACFLLLLFAANAPEATLPFDAAVTAEGGGAEVDFSLPPVPYEPPPEGAFDLVVARNLFAIDRAPPPDDVVSRPAGQAEANASELVLTGVLLGETAAAAILHDRRSDETMRLALNEDYRGWRLERLTATTAVLRRGEEEIMLRLSFVPEATHSRDPTVRRDTGMPLPVQIRRGDGRGNPVPAGRQPDINGSES